MAGLHALGPPVVDQPLGHLGVRTVEAVERAGSEVEVQLRTILQRGLADAVEDFQRQPARVIRRLQHHWRHGADQHGLLHPPGAVAADVARHLAATGGKAHQGDILQVQRFDHRSQVVGVVVHVVAFPRLAGTPVTAAVMGDHAIALRGKKQHLRLPAIRAEWPAVAEGDHRAVLRPPVLVVELHAIGGGDGAGGLRGDGGVGGLRRLCGLGRKGRLQREGQQTGSEGAGDEVHGMGLRFERVVGQAQSAMISDTSMFPRVALE
ncbi:hypothetical protein D3C77_468100 [compost metagenome]